MQPALARALVLQQIPLMKDGRRSDRSIWCWSGPMSQHDHAPSEIAPIPDGEAAEVRALRARSASPLRRSSDGELLTDVARRPTRVFGDLAKELQSGSNLSGVHRLGRSAATASDA